MSLRQLSTRLLRSRRYYCDKLWAACSIRWNGDLEPCACACGDTPVFSIPETPFDEAWNSEPYRKSRAFLLRSLGRDDLPPVDLGEVFDICRNCSVPLIDRHSVVRWRLKGMGLSLRARLRAAGPADRAMLARKAENYTNLLRSLRRPGETVAFSPILGNIDASNLCNLRCPMCKVGTGEIDHPRGMMSLERFSQILEQVGPGLIRLELYRYGEPLLNPRVAQMARLAAERYRIRTTISTNFSMALSDEALGELARCALDTLVVAADGAEQATHEKYRQGGSLAQTLENLRAFLRLRESAPAPRPKVIWQYLVFSHNEREIARARRMAAEMGVDRFVAVEPSVPQYDNFSGWVSRRRGGRGDADEARNAQVLEAALLPAQGVVAGAPFELLAKVRNTTREAWAKESGDSGSARLGIKLYDSENRFLHEAGRGLLAEGVAPGREALLRATLSAPAAPGRYRLKLDMLREGEFWFEWKTGHRSKPLWIDIDVV